MGGCDSVLFLMSELEKRTRPRMISDIENLCLNLELPPFDSEDKDKHDAPSVSL